MRRRDTALRCRGFGELIDDTLIVRRQRCQCSRLAFVETLDVYRGRQILRDPRSFNKLVGPWATKTPSVLNVGFERRMAFPI